MVLSYGPYGSIINQLSYVWPSISLMDGTTGWLKYFTAISMQKWKVIFSMAQEFYFIPWAVNSQQH